VRDLWHGDADPRAKLAQAKEERDNGRLADAEATCRRALELAPGDPEVHRVLGTILYLQERNGEAIASYEESIKLDPRGAKAVHQLAIVLAEEGRLAEAAAADRRALELEPALVGAHSHLAQLKRFEPGDPDLAALETAVADAPDRDAVLLHFALGKAYEDAGDHDRAFEHLLRANTLKRATLDYDVEDAVASFAHTAQVFSHATLAGLAGVGHSSDLPVVVVGMPRSGTTLVEQILSSHPEIAAVGERADLQELAMLMPVLNDGVPFPDAVLSASADDFRRLGAGYVERLRMREPGSRRIVDKAPLNFRYLGFLRLVLPNAHVVHCVRDPLDTCVSCYSLLFSGVDFSYDLRELGRYYRAYEALMEHWRTVLPAGWIHEVRYEDLVVDVESAARALVAHCGLAWDAACLDFHENTRGVRTASFVQVRRPVYRSSVARWRRFERHLGPLRDALDT
jgi:tetratricopeptide (TPR) repeat protein